MKRQITNHPEFSITRDGRVWRGEQQLPGEEHCGVYGLRHSVVWIGETRHYIWRLLSEMWYECSMIVPRDGNLMDWRHENTIRLSQITKTTLTENITPEAILLIWKTYERDRVPCRELAEKTGLLSYSDADYRALIGDILLAGVR